MSNLFLDAMDTDQQKAIDEIKANKAFALQLIYDLDRVFQTNYEILDDQDSVVIRMKRSVGSNWYGSFSFIVNKDGIKFRSSNLGYYESSQFKGLGKLYKKYKSSGTTCDENFLREGSTRHGFVNFVIPISRDPHVIINGNNLKDALRDIIYLMEQNQYHKRF
jgi:hypothetical protein